MLNVLLIILILLVVTRAFGELAERAALPALVGELVAGILLFAVTRPLQCALPAWHGPAQSRVIFSQLARWRPALSGRAGAMLRGFSMRLAESRQQQGAAIMQGALAGLLWLALFAILLSTLVLSA